MNLNTIQIQELQTITQQVLERIYQEDMLLISRGGMEQSIAFRFGLYFNHIIKNIPWLSTLDLDMEYNKNGSNPKFTQSRPNGSRPDFILHTRGSNDENFLIIEFKGWWDRRKRNDDRNKMIDFTNQEGNYKYGLGILVEFRRENFNLELIVNCSTHSV